MMKVKYILIALLMALLLVSPSSAWLSPYAYRQMHNITGCSTWTSNQTDYAINIIVNNLSSTSNSGTMYTNGHSQPSWSDLRFTNLSDGEYSYWIENTTSTSAGVWVKLPEIANSSAINTSFYVYYGYPLASSTVNGTNTFTPFFDDWSSGTFSSSKWGASSGTWSVVNYAAATTVESQYWNATTMTPIQNGIFSIKLKYTNTLAAWGSEARFFDDYSYDSVWWDATPTEAEIWWDAMGDYWIVADSISSGTYYTYKLYLYGSTAKWYKDSTLLTSLTGILNTYPGGLSIYAHPLVGSVYIDDFYVSKYIVPTPLHGVWSDEESIFVQYIDFDKSAYSLGETANLTTYIPTEFWDTPNYTYYVYLFKSTDMVIPVDTISVTSQTQPNFIDTSTYSTGTYYAMFYMTYTGTGVTYFIDYDYADFQNGVTISGTTYNTTSGSSVASATVGITQGGSTTSYTSDASGYYTTTSPLNVGQAITVAGSLAGYTPTSDTFTPAGAANITKNIPFVPNNTEVFYNWTHNGTSIAGLASEMPYYSPAESAFCNLSNATWYSNLTLPVTGWFQFDVLANSSAYTLSAGKSGFDAYTASITSGAENLTWHNFTFGADFTLTVYIKDAASGAPITSNVTVTIDNLLGTTSSSTTSSGSATFTGLSGNYDISASCFGYTAGTASVTMDDDKSVTISMVIPSGSSVYYTPHDVKLIVHDYYGNPLDGTTLTVTPISTTLDSWSWLQSVLGIPTAANADTTVQTGTCDYMGSATFVLVKEVYYQVDIDNVAEGVDETLYVYPKDDTYIFSVGTDDGYTDPVSLNTNITWIFSNTTVNATHENLTLTYVDYGNTTSNISFWVRTHASPVSTCYQSYSATPSSCSFSYTAPSNNGQEYYYGFDAVKYDGSNYTASKAIQFQKLVDLGISSAYYPWIAAAFLIVIGALFSVISVKFGAVLIPIFAWLFFYMKWISLTWQQAGLLTILLTIGVFAYVRKQEDKVGG